MRKIDNVFEVPIVYPESELHAPAFRLLPSPTQTTYIVQLFKYIRDKYRASNDQQVPDRFRIYFDLKAGLPFLYQPAILEYVGEQLRNPQMRELITQQLVDSIRYSIQLWLVQLYYSIRQIDSSLFDSLKQIEFVIISDIGKSKYHHDLSKGKYKQHRQTALVSLAPAIQKSVEEYLAYLQSVELPRWFESIEAEPIRLISGEFEKSAPEIASLFKTQIAIRFSSVILRNYESDFVPYAFEQFDQNTNIRAFAITMSTDKDMLQLAKFQPAPHLVIRVNYRKRIQQLITLQNVYCSLLKKDVSDIETCVNRYHIDKRTNYTADILALAGDKADGVFALMDRFGYSTALLFLQTIVPYLTDNQMLPTDTGLYELIEDSGKRDEFIKYAREAVERAKLSAKRKQLFYSLISNIESDPQFREQLLINYKLVSYPVQFRELKSHYYQELQNKHALLVSNQPAK